MGKQTASSRGKASPRSTPSSSSEAASSIAHVTQSPIPVKAAKRYGRSKTANMKPKKRVEEDDDDEENEADDDVTLDSDDDNGAANDDHEQEEDGEDAEEGEDEQEQDDDGDDEADADEASDIEGENEEEDADEEAAEQDEDEDENENDEEDNDEDEEKDARMAAEEEAAERAERRRHKAARAKAAAADEENEDDEADEGDDAHDGNIASTSVSSASTIPRPSKSPHALPVPNNNNNSESTNGDDASYLDALARRGVVYLSRIPPFMSANKLRWLFEQHTQRKKHGRIGRIFLTPEDASLARKRKKSGGNAGKRFVDGWVEFECKKVARWMADSLNGQPIGGSRRSKYAEDLWMIKYLKGFKWHHLTEKIAYEKQIRSTKIREEMTQARRETEHYLQQVERSKRMEKKMQQQKRKAPDAGDEDHQAKRERLFHQRSLLDGRVAMGGSKRKQ